jgi:flagellin
MLSIKNNIMSENVSRNLNASYGGLSKSVQRLSSGLRVGGAADDAAGLAVREAMRGEIAILDQSVRNANDGISMLQTAEGALGQIDSILTRMQTLAEQSATGSYNDTQRGLMNSEYTELVNEIDRIVATTDFNGVNMLNNTSTVDLHVGDNAELISVDGAVMDASTLGVDTGIATAGDATGMLTALEAAHGTVDETRATFGASINRLESAVSVLQINKENLMAAESRISDVDVASEMAAFTRNQVLAQSGVSMLSQANSIPQMALQLLG